MTGGAMKVRLGRRNAAVWFLVGAGLLLVAAANAHLVYVAMTSQPDCVTHIRPGESAETGSFSAARSACSETN
jgi:hypothetical protein